MNIRVHSSELNRIMKTIVQCTDQKDITNRANVRITHEDNKLTFAASNGSFSAVMSTPILGGDGETFCVDASMFAKVCAMQSGEINLIADGKVCTIKGVGRTRLPIVEANIPGIDEVEGQRMTVNAGDFSRCYGAVSYAVSADQSRIQLTGVLVESDGKSIRMAALDGFQLSVEEIPGTGDAAKIIIPGGFMKLVAQCVGDEEELMLTTDGKAVIAEAEGTKLRSGLLAGEFVDYNRILPKEFAILCKVNVNALLDALKAGNVVNGKQNLVKLVIGAEDVTVQNNSEQADYEAKVSCMTQGDELKIAFNQKYLTNMISAIGEDEAEIGFNSAVTPVVIRTETGCRLTLPVRVM